MNGELFTIGGWFEAFRATKDAYKVTIGVPLNALDRNQIGALIQLGALNKEGFFMLKTASFNADEMELAELLQVDKDEDHVKPSERVYKRLFVLYKKREAKGTLTHPNFKSFYEAYIENVSLKDISRRIDNEDI